MQAQELGEAVQLRNFMLGRFGKTVYIPVVSLCVSSCGGLIKREECVSRRENERAKKERKTMRCRGFIQRDWNPEEVSVLSCSRAPPCEWQAFHSHTLCPLSHTTNRLLSVFFILGNDSVAEVQILCLTSSSFPFFLLFSDSRRRFQPADPSSPWTPSRSHRSCSRSSRPRCCPVPKDWHELTHSLLISHSFCSVSSDTRQTLGLRLSRCVLNSLSVSDYLTLSELYQVWRRALKEKDGSQQTLVGRWRRGPVGCQKNQADVQ